jgi:NAD(P)-dependent dehydrogenase (short-subunit alcohol dehydrogenase family)/acyl carrier protein
VGEAFRLMQSAGHVGKIVVVPPPVETVAAPHTGAFAPGEGVQLVIGGTRGFGLATALWLAESGARRIVVASLSGKVDPAGRARINALRKRGVMFAVERVDVTDAGDVAGLIARVAYAHGPVTGIFHAAVTLRDGMLDGIAEADLAAVLAPKVQGADNLDRASRDQPIERFVLYSSVSALVGNPGQGAYAAANGYLEGLARARRAEGLPALAVQWGAIADVGLLADRAETLESLSRVSGVVAMQSADALARLGTILAQAGDLADPVVACAEFAANGALHSLPVPASPAFAGVFARWSSAVVEAGMSLAELIEGRSESEAQQLLGALVVEEVAQILRLAAQDIDLDAPIDSLGMDSLMALELRMSIESRYSVELPVMAITAAGSLRELSHRILRIVQQDGSEATVPVSETESALIASHGGEATLRAFEEGGRETLEPKP